MCIFVLRCWLVVCHFDCIPFLGLFCTIRRRIYNNIPILLYCVIILLLVAQNRSGSTGSQQQLLYSLKVAHGTRGGTGGGTGDGAVNSAAGGSSTEVEESDLGITGV